MSVTGMADKLVELGKITNKEDINGTQQEIILVKDGTSYTGKISIKIDGNIP